MSLLSRWRDEPRDETLAPILAGVLLALPTVLVRFPPMTDLALHDAVVGMMRHLHDAAYFPPDLYQLNLGHPNQLFHVAAWALSYPLGVDGGCKAVIALAQLGILLGGARLARHLGRSQWTALLLAPLAIGWSYFWGLVTNLVGFAVLLYALPALDRATERPSSRGLAVSALWMALLYFAHESVMVVACSAVLVFALGHPLRGKETSLRLAPIAVGLALFLGQALLQRRKLGDAHGGASSFEYHTFGDNLRTVPATLTGSLDPVSRGALFSLAVLGIVALVVERWRAHDAPVPRQPTAFIHRYRFELVALGNALAYFAMPWGFAGGTMFNHRFYHPAYALLALSAAPAVARRRPSLLLKLAAAVLPLGILFIDWPQFYEADQLGRDLDQLLPKIAMDSGVAFLEVSVPGGGRIFSSGTSGARALAQRGGRLNFSLTESNIAPVQINPAMPWTEATLRIGGNSLNLRPGHDLHMFRYLLIHSREPTLALFSVAALQPDAHFVDMQGEWLLVESTLPLVALDSPEPPMPSPPPPTLRTRLRQVIKASMDDGSIPAGDVESREAAARSIRALTSGSDDTTAGAPH